MKIEKYLLTILTLICITIISSNCSHTDDTDNSNIDIQSTDAEVSKTTIMGESEIEGDVTLILDSYNFNLSEPFEDDLLKNLNENELSILRNSIYAKYGYKFSTKKYSDYFSQFSWYTPIDKNVEAKLNNIDKQNIKQIIALEKEQEPLQFKSSKLGFILTFPKSWEGKYRVEEFDMGITIYFKPEKKMDENYGEFFSIINTESPYADERIYDTVGDKRYFETDKNKYLIGGPTDFPFPEDHPEFEKFRKMNSEKHEVVKNLERLE
ncbi:YARHG domain-containing protein [Wukongibacter baidiensis]|uniref:YARHG domain-containing protein n=1 Tax=Wukongibacter baidiensis TaxID=1723361 RepID=UPI003D7FAF73